MSEGKSNFELTRRRVLGGVVTAGAASAAAGAGTYAVFSDQERSTGNTVQAGTLNLTVDGKNSATTTVSISNVAPGDSGSGSTKLKNTGSVDGSVDLEFGDITSSGGPGNEAEGVGEVGDSGGDLGEELEVDVYVGNTKVGNGGTFKALFDGKEPEPKDDTTVPLNAGEEKQLKISWKLPSSVGNKVQGDKAKADITVQLNQKDSQ